METEKLTSEQLEKVINLYEKNKDKFYLYSLGIIGFLILMSIIPVSFLPKSNRVSDTVDKSLNLIQSLGFFWWFLLVSIMAVAFIWAIYLDLKLTKLNKDIVEKKILSEVFTVKEVLISQSHNVYSIILTSPSVKKLVRNIGPKHINSFSVGQQFGLKLLKNSHVLITELEQDFKLL